MEIEGWIIQNFYASFMLVMLLIFQMRTTRLKTGRMYSNILICTLILILSETIGRFFEVQGGKYLIFAKIGYYIMFFLDPVDLLYAVRYLDCWMDDASNKQRAMFRNAFRILVLLNTIVVAIAAVFSLDWFFYFKDDVYYRGRFYLIRVIIIALYIILVGVYAIVFRKNIMSQYRNLIMFLPGLAILGAFFQVNFGLINATYAGIAMACLILYFSFQSNDANMDYLTGVYNRRGIDFQLESMINTKGKNFTALMMDIDNFKEINDTMGHDEGDKAIKTMANILVDVFGEDSSIGRFGGDEFCIVSDNVDYAETDNRIKQVREKIKKTCLKHHWPESVDVSCGYEIYSQDSGMSLSEFSEHIDKLMYNEKEAHHAEEST